MADLAVVLPEEIIMQEILIRLPIKSMVRCRCVCKSWNSKFYNPDFISHLNVSQNPKRRDNDDDDYLILMNSYNYQLSPYHLHLSILSRQKLSETRIIHNHVPFPLSLGVDDIHLVGSINGLVCIAFHVEGYHQFVLWNPAIRVSKKISVPKHLCMPPVWWCGEGCYPMMYGFGWDSVTNDYKLIAKTLSSVSPAGVYSCATDSWTYINIVNFRDGPGFYGLPPCVIVNGSPYWIYGHHRRQLTDVILKFDTSNNEFTYLNTPGSGSDYDYDSDSDSDSDSDNHTSLMDLNDCLAFIEYSRCDIASRWYVATVYLFDEHRNIWMHMYTIDRCVINGWDKAVYSFKYGGEIMFLNMKHLYMCDPKSREIKCRRRYTNCGSCHVKSRGTKRKRGPSDDHDCGFAYLVDVFSYNPSLVALPGMKTLHQP